LKLKACHDGANESVKNCNNVERYNISGFELSKVLYTCGLFGKLELTAGSKLVLWAFCTYYNPMKKTMFPSQATLAKQLGVSEKTIERAVKELKERGLIVYETKKVNHYGFSAKFWFMTGIRPSDVVGAKDSKEKVFGDTLSAEMVDNIGFEVIKNGVNPLVARDNKELEYTKRGESSREDKTGVNERQNVGWTGRQNVGQTNKHEKINEKKVFPFKKEGGRGFAGYERAEDARINRTTPSVTQTRAVFEEIEEAKKAHQEAILPIDYPKERAYEWIRGLDPKTRKALKSVKILCEKWHFDEFLSENA